MSRAYGIGDLWNLAAIASLAISAGIAIAEQAATSPGARKDSLAFRKADADASGTLSRAEAQQALPALGRDFDLIDTNRDGQISPEEIRDWRKARRGARKASGGPTFDELFGRADADGDGALSMSEALRGMPRLAKKFGRIDVDGDGRITRDEMKTFLEARRAARAGGG